MNTIKLNRKAVKTTKAATPVSPPAPKPQAAVLPDRFFFIWNPYRSRPKTRHPTAEAALAEVERLKMICRDDEFYVYEARRIEAGS